MMSKTHKKEQSRSVHRNKRRQSRVTSIKASKVVSIPEPVDNTNMILIIHDRLRTLYSEEEADAFVANPEFSNYKQYNSAIQRGLANRVLVNKLLIHRAKYNCSVVDAVYCLVPDGDNASWVNVLESVIIPFLKANKVKLR